MKDNKQQVSSANASFTKAIEAAGGIKVVSDALGISRQALYYFRSQDRFPPVERAIQLEILSKGQVTVEQMRPDMLSTWAYLRNGFRENPAQPARKPTAGGAGSGVAR